MNLTALFVCICGVVMGYIVGRFWTDYRVKVKIADLERQLHILQFDKRLIKEKKL